jgi:hypothetical protein
MTSDELKLLSLLLFQPLFVKHTFESIDWVEQLARVSFITWNQRLSLKVSEICGKQTSKASVKFK